MHVYGRFYEFRPNGRHAPWVYVFILFILPGTNNIIRENGNCVLGCFVLSLYALGKIPRDKGNFKCVATGRLYGYEKGYYHSEKVYQTVCKSNSKFPYSKTTIKVFLFCVDFLLFYVRSLLQTVIFSFFQSSHGKVIYF